MELSISDLEVVLARRTVLHGLSAVFASGRITAVLGANGAGKSTLMRALAGLIPVSNGKLAMHGRDMAGMTMSERSRMIGYLPQDADVHWNMTVCDLVALGRLPHRDSKAAAIDAALTATDTSRFATRPVRTLSGGERARVLLARVLAGEPAWLLADEPLASLDPLHQLETLALLRKIAAQGIGVIVVLHDLTQAARVADDVMLLKDGQILANGPAVDVLTQANLAAAYGVKVAMLEHAGIRIFTPITRA